jgi:acyl carrier protein
MTVRPTKHQIDDWLVSYVAELLARPASDIDRDATFDSFGIDSANVIGITGELQAWLGITIDPEAAYEYPTIRALAHHLAGLTEAASSAGDGTGRGLS